MEQLISRKTLLTYPDFKLPFEIHIDTKYILLGACISHARKPIVFYNRKLNPAKNWYTTTEQKLLSTVKFLKPF
jgi:RNase H-like domain found in reverse transcriptase